MFVRIPSTLCARKQTGLQRHLGHLLILRTMLLEDRSSIIIVVVH